MSSQHWSKLSSVCLFVTICALAVATPYAVSGAGFTTVNEAVDGPGHCDNGNPGVNCNHYDGKEYVWLNGGPLANELGPDGQYFFAVLAPGGQSNPNDGSPGNLSSGSRLDRTFTVTAGEVSGYGGSHDSDGPFIRLFPYADTTNPGGVYIMAICKVPAGGGSVNPRDCKYDAFKVKAAGAATVAAQLSGKKYQDTELEGIFNGALDAGEVGLEGWTISISCDDGTSGTTTTGADGSWSFQTLLKVPATGTTTCHVNEVQQADWSQTGPQVNQSSGAGGAMAVISDEFGLGYRVTIPNDAPSTVEGLHFGNIPETGGN